MDNLNRFFPPCLDMLPEMARDGELVHKSPFEGWRVDFASKPKKKIRIVSGILRVKLLQEP